MAMVRSDTTKIDVYLSLETVADGREAVNLSGDQGYSKDIPKDINNIKNNNKAHLLKRRCLGAISRDL